MKRRRREIKKKKERRGDKKKKETHHERFDLHGERGGEGGGKNAGGKIASTLATRKKGGEKSAIPAGVAGKKKKRNDTPCIVQNETDGGAAKGEKREAMGCIKTPAMKCKISTRSCVAVFRVQAGGKSIRSVTNHDLTRFDSWSFASWSILPFVFPSGCPMYGKEGVVAIRIDLCTRTEYRSIIGRCLKI